MFFDTYSLADGFLVFYWFFLKAQFITLGSFTVAAVSISYLLYNSYLTGSCSLMTVSCNAYSACI